MKLYFRKIGICLLSVVLTTGCMKSDSGQENQKPEDNEIQDELDIGQMGDDRSEEKVEDFSFQVNPETFELVVSKDGQEMIASPAGEVQRVEDLVTQDNLITWKYPELSIAAAVKKENGYLSVEIESQMQEENRFVWPKVDSSEYYLPLGEGVRVTRDNIVYGDYLKGQELKGIESLSMQFFAVGEGESSLVFVIENPYNNSLRFQDEGEISFDFEHFYPEINENKKYSFRIYPADNNPVSVAKVYRNYIMEEGRFKTLEQKAWDNADIKKLYGAPHIYLWNERLISDDDINWQAFLKIVDGKQGMELSRRFAKLPEGSEIVDVLESLKHQDYVDKYQKNTICSALSELLKRDDFYIKGSFDKTDNIADELIHKGVENLNEREMIQLNKHILAANMAGVFSPADEWAKERTAGVIDSLKASGIENAWIGLDHWEMAFAEPSMVTSALSAGYLIATYDSYHSIHEPGKEQWATAAFEDSSLYENAVVARKDGEKIEGFQGVGRKLNPTLSLPSVKERVDRILAAGTAFNSWFIDCDATGEIYDDYSKQHVTTEQQDLEARLNRMAYIRDNKSMVIGSEGGNDFAAADIAFAHGLELQTFSWMDEDMKRNKESEYYIGRYYSPSGGVPENFKKQVPIKDKYRDIFLNPSVKVPLYKLVYNDSIVTGYHWDWSTYKIKGETENRMLYEVLYNVPPMYHLDLEEWESKKDSIVKHTAFWSKFSRKVINLEMTGFETLTEDGLVQQTVYGDSIKVVANYTDASVSVDGNEIPAKSLAVYDGADIEIYTPEEG